MALETSDLLCQSLGLTRAVIEVAQQDVFKTHAPATDGDVVAAILKQLLIRIGPCGGDQLFPQGLIGRMQAHRQGELGAAEALKRQFSQPWQCVGHTNGADGDLPHGHAQIPAEAINRRQHMV